MELTQRLGDKIAIALALQRRALVWGMTGDDVDWIVPHQANLRIIKGTASRMSVPMERVIVTVQDHGNTSAASIRRQHSGFMNRIKKLIT